MQKHGQEGWKIEWRKDPGYTWVHTSDPCWNLAKGEYRAVGPRKRVELKRGMEIKDTRGRFYITTTSESKGVIRVANDDATRIENACNLSHDFSHYRWPNGDGIWLPIEGEPEIISMEGVE